MEERKEMGEDGSNGAHLMMFKIFLSEEGIA